MIDDIIKLKRKYGLLEDDFTIEKAYLWYDWAIKHGFVAVMYESGKLVGFCEWITARDIPESFNQYPTSPEDGNVIIIGTLIAERRYVMWRLKDFILNKYKNRRAIVWHRRRDDRLVSIRRRKCSES